MKSDENYCLSLFIMACAACFMSCENNAWNGFGELSAGTAANDSDTIVLSLNELLFDPVGEGADYVELVNVSGRELDLSHYYIHNRNSKGELNKGRQLSAISCKLQPGEYCLLSSDTSSVAESYGRYDSGIWLQVNGFPSMPNAGGTIVITDSLGTVTDECSFLPAMHHPFLTDREGVALEKLHPSFPSNMAASWASASADVSYGTPGRPNSQLRTYVDECPSGDFFLPRSWLFPLHDDSTAMLTLIYKDIYAYLPVVTIEVYSRYGEKVATLAENGILGVNGLYSWYGQDDKGNILPSGSYVLRVITYDLSGNVFRQSFVCTVLQ